MTLGTPSRLDLFRRGSSWAKAPDVAYTTLWFEYLKISPSYELARRLRTGAWTAADEAKKPADFDSVLAVYDDLGDVRSVRFRDWWLATAIEYFGYKGAKPRVMRLSTIGRRATEGGDRLIGNTQAYLDDHWQKQGKPTTMIVAIPVGLTKAQITKEVIALLAKHSEADRKLVSTSPKYGLISRKMDSKSLFKYLLCVWVRAKFPQKALWRVGVLAKVSSTYSARLDPNAQLEKHQYAEERNALKIVTSRAISRGILIAENAARGYFPSYASNDRAVAPDWDDLRHAVKRRMDLDRASIAKEV